mmetsp:Transcript_2487/g.3647  ORF Transcript_2487/g.3647 Transcript_2487/m.3647 type:complete len:336 (-) Transcript_2487:284-1291(-)|eukprot:CAMPEP_0184744480 /NCGR_PEP_ID=MMETSP0315-20130426/7219_1 /TAXON_ID=101924 /ORGANISM="Rhodosorus marinus, Strain UTEX LB 2760" /LENGTH=335 /DNA_ID=CAMNT_0027216187 /DNA_START=31 /DNA_END=1038 /DNA_ORIENTATION=+
MTLNFVAGGTLAGSGASGLGGKSSVCRTSAPTRTGLRVRTLAEAKETLSVKEKADIGALGGIDDLFEARELLGGLFGQGDLKKWNQQKLSVRPVSVAELKMNARLDADSLGLTQKNTIDLKLASFVVIGGSSILAVLCQAIFSGDLAYFSSYLIGGISIAFLAIGSTVPGVLTALITTISANLRPDFKERLLLHEAGHFLAGYLCGVPVKKYDVNPITTGVTIFGGRFLTEDVAQGRIGRDDVNALSVVALAGPVAEVLKYGQAEGGMADLKLLQNVIVRTKPPLLPKEQQDQTRWGALMAYTVLKKYSAEYENLVKAMKANKSVPECIKAIEQA